MKPGDVIPKPWGSEHIVDLNQSYCIKYLRIRRGQRLSKQYHEQKRETMLLVRGNALLQLTDERDAKKDIVMEFGEPYVVEPGTVHRIEGMSTEPAVILEVSTPEVDDIVRLQDDYGR
ncbi:MAG: cupin domain-containing protein [Chloroflexota bacterium]|nr:cupin domain-containing protein [Chloroflexota bacterium]MDE2885644.1 cupin domain-containing protein [Chloroflexota bacterium]